MNPTLLFYNAIAAVITTTIHEFTKALVSSSLGDPLPKRDRRVSLNPIRHIEPIGFIIMAAMGFGWGKPVETASIYYKNRRNGTLLTYIIPSAANLLLGIIVYAAMLMANISFELRAVLSVIAMFNLRHAFFNFIPIYPLNGSKILSVIVNPNQAVAMAGRQMFLQVILIFAIFLGLVARFIDPICHAVLLFVVRVVL